MLTMKKIKMSYPKIYFLRSSPLGYDTVSLQIVPLTKESGYGCVHFRSNAPGEGVNQSRLLPAMGSITE